MNECLGLTADTRNPIMFAKDTECQTLGAVMCGGKIGGRLKIDPDNDSMPGFWKSSCGAWCDGNPLECALATGKYCRQGNLKTDICRNKVCSQIDCDKHYEGYCRLRQNLYSEKPGEYIKDIVIDKNEGTIKDEDNICACFLPVSYYQDYYEDLRREIPGGWLGIPERRDCFFEPCKLSGHKPFILNPLSKYPLEPCPNVIECIQKIKFDTAGRIDGNVGINQTQKCVQYYKESEIVNK